MLWYSYNIIIIVTVIILQFLCACFVHPGTPQLTVVSFDIFFLLFLSFYLLITMMSELLKYLNERLGVFQNVRQEKQSQLKA